MGAVHGLAAGVLLLSLTACTGGGDDAAPSAARSSAAPTVDPAGQASAQASASAAAAAEQTRLAQAYAPALRPTIESVYDQVQPMLDAFDAFDRPRRENAQVRDDVFAAGGARLALEAGLRALRQVDAPTAAAARVAELDGSLAGLAKAAGTLSAATRATPGPGGTVPDYQRGEAALDAAVSSWAKAVTAVNGGKEVPLTPRRDRTAVRAPSSKGAWLFVAGQACGRAAAPRVAAAVLPTIPLPRVDAARIKTEVHAPLAKVRAGGGRAANAAAANGLAELGSSVCAGLFAVREG